MNGCAGVEGDKYYRSNTNYCTATYIAPDLHHIPSHETPHTQTIHASGPVQCLALLRYSRSERDEKEKQGGVPASGGGCQSRR